MKIILTTIIFLITVAGYSQDRFKFKTISFRTVYFDRYDTYIAESEWKDTSAVIVINTSDKKITFYSNGEKSFDIISDAISYDDDEGVSNILKWSALDENSRRCNVRLMKLKDNLSPADLKGRYNLFIDYKGVTYVFIISKSS